jgi:SAM-dependent methyltransferase
MATSQPDFGRPTDRFTNRAEHYHRHRPRYPDLILETIRRETGLEPQHIVADIGSGTGISSEIFLRNGNAVFAVEPNDDMRLQAERELSTYAGFRSVNGRAESTTLSAQSVDLIVCGQAFHWFDAASAKSEFSRILKADGWLALFWNLRRRTGGFNAAFEALVHKYGADYRGTGGVRNRGALVKQLFSRDYSEWTFANRQQFDCAGLEGRLFSCSYLPLPSDSNHEPMIRDLRALFGEFQVSGRVSMEYDTHLSLGRL